MSPLCLSLALVLPLDGYCNRRTGSALGGELAPPLGRTGSALRGRIGSALRGELAPILGKDGPTLHLDSTLELTHVTDKGDTALSM